MLANQAISERAYSYLGKEPCDEAAKEGKSHRKVPTFIGGGHFGREGGLSRREEASTKAVSCSQA